MTPMIRRLLPLFLVALLAAPALAADSRDEAAKLNDAGIRAIDAKEFAKAIDLFTRARSLLPLDLTIRKNLATARSRYGGELLEDGKGEEALRQFRFAASLEPGLAVHHANLGIALVRLGRTEEGKKALENACRVDPACVTARTELGAIAYREGELREAIDEWERAVAAAPDRKDVAEALARARREYEIEKDHRTQESDHFQVSWDGEKDASTGSRILRICEDAYERVGRELAIFPEGRVRVILYSGREFEAVTGAHSWVGGLYDGRIRIPVKDFLRAEDEIRDTIFHEYTHVAVHAVAPACPSWLNEGLAQVYEGKDLRPGAARLKRAKQAGKLLPLSELRAGFTRFDDADRARLAYAESLSFVRFLMDDFSPERVGRFLRAIGGGKSPADAATECFFRSLDDLFAEWSAEI